MAIVKVCHEYREFLPISTCSKRIIKCQNGPKPQVFVRFEQKLPCVTQETTIPPKRFIFADLFRSKFMHQPGTHLMVNYRWYQHHGISLGDGRVVHFGRGVFDMDNARIEVVSEQVFAGGRPICVVDSSVSFEPEVVLQRALDRVGEGGYELFENNCEHFVHWCRSGEMASQQASMYETMIRQSAAAGTRATIGRQLVAASLKTLPSIAARGTATAALVADAAQTVSEIVATSAGCEKNKSRRIGKKVGFGSSATLGFALGGPAGAAITVGYWAVGQAIGKTAVNKTQDMIKNVATR
jgi:hypothetical protein